MDQLEQKAKLETLQQIMKLMDEMELGKLKGPAKVEVAVESEPDVTEHAATDEGVEEMTAGLPADAAPKDSAEKPESDDPEMLQRLLQHYDEIKA